MGLGGVDAEDDALDAGVELSDVPAELLAQRERNRVLEMGAADLDDVRELLGAYGESIAQGDDAG